MSAPCPTLGFVVSVKMRRGSVLQLIAELSPLLASHGLGFHARDRDSDELEITRIGSQVSDADRQLVLDFAKRWSDRAELRASPIHDLSEV